MEFDYSFRTIIVDNVTGQRHLVERLGRTRQRTQDEDEDEDEEDEIVSIDGHYYLVPVGNKKARDAMLGLEEVLACHARQTECAVCLQDVDEVDMLMAMPCSHAFHQQCIFEWLQRKRTCPLCRRELPTPQPQQEEDDDLWRRV
ncbi:hypothetical protein U9M48_022135 [Paspalum notatum var. saurae]|uniref:RING-type domain-containing protein n=1 Tax=Paspalum notatum var. saurae TaxID=547442 RepID=A0AAQ3TJ68_PASNO